MKQALKNIIKRLLPRTLLQLAKRQTAFFTSEEVEQAKNNSGKQNHIELLDKISLKRSLYDDMYDNNGGYYLKVGLSAIECIEKAISESKPKEIKEVLDMPCGFGRVLRFLAEYFPDAGLTACDINKNGVDFCKKEMNAKPVYSKINLRTFNMPQKFDLIWCGSLATHLNSDQTVDLINFFYRHLNVGGLLVFSMHGKRVLEYMRTGEKTYNLDNAGIKNVLSQIETAGYGYADYFNEEGYGISVATPEWMQARLNENGKWRNHRFAETAWIQHHDIYSVVKL